MVKYRRDYKSKNVEYRGSAGGGGLGGGMSFPKTGGGKAGAGLGGAGLIGIIIAILFAVLGGNGGGGTSTGLGGATGSSASSGEVAETNVYLEAVFDDVQGFWEQTFAANNQTYPLTKMVLFNESVSTGGCGNATVAVGPFYCPADSKVYLDQDFFAELESRFGAPGDFAEAYVIAHEIGHHIQNVTGISDDVRAQQAQDPSLKNDLSVRLELQADCLAGVWAMTASNRPAGYEDDPNGTGVVLERGDLEEGLVAAAAVGDDRLGAGAEHNWTHGSADQREAWFTYGVNTGDPAACQNTFDSAQSGTRVLPPA